MSTEETSQSVPDRSDNEADLRGWGVAAPAEEPGEEASMAMVSSPETGSIAEEAGSGRVDVAPPEPASVPEAPAPDVVDAALVEAADPRIESRVEEVVEAEVEAIQVDGEQLARRLRSLDGSLAELAALERRHVGVIEQLHADNTTLRRGELALALKPLLLDIARLYDDVDGIVERGGEAHPSASLIRDLISDLLERHDVTMLRPEEGEAFDPTLYVAAGVVETSDPGLDTRISSVERAGFIRDGAHVVRAARVRVFRHLPAPEVADGIDTVEPADAESRDPFPRPPLTRKRLNEQQDLRD